MSELPLAGRVVEVIADLGEAAHPSTFVGDVDGSGPDLALVEITGSGIDVPAMGLAAVDRDSVSGNPVERCRLRGVHGAEDG